MQPYGAPPGYGWQQPAPMAPMPMQQQPPKGGGGGGAIIAIVAALLMLVAGGAIAGGIYYFILRKPAPHLAQWAPKNASLYVELPSFQHSVLSAAAMKPLDHSRMDDRQMKQDLVLAFSNAFGVSQADARAVVTSLSASAFVARDTNHNIGNAAVLVTFTNGSVEKILQSSRFGKAGPFLSGGTRYTLERRPPALIAPNATLAEHMLSDMATTGYGVPLDLVWFPRQRMLAFGDDTLVTDVATCVGGKCDSLEKSPVYQTAKKSFEKGSDVAFFFDPHDLDDVRDPEGKKLLDGWLHGRQPITGALKLVKAGVMLDAHATLDGPDVPSADLLPPAPKLELPHRLPADTVAYFAFSTKTKLKGPAIRALMTKSLSASDAKKLDDGLTQTAATLGFSFDDVVDMVGDETAIGILLDPAFKLDTTNGMNDEIANVGLVWAIAVKDPNKARDILGKLRAQLETKDMAEKVKVTTVGPGEWRAEVAQPSATLPLPTLTVKFDGRQVVAVVASPTMTTRALTALDTGKGSLHDDPAHEMAFDAMPKDANFYVWTDTGRITNVMMDAESHVARHKARALLPLDAVRLTGPDRVTSAIALRAKHEGAGWSIDLDSLNMPALGFFSLADDLDIDSAMRKTEAQ
jgi:hypothetical protein